MIIGIDASRAAARQRSGTENYAFHLLRSLVPLAIKDGHQVRLYSNNQIPPDLYQPDENCEIVHIPFPRIWTHMRLGIELQRWPPDVFFTPAHVIPWTYFGKSVATVHDLGFHFYPSTHPWRQRAYLRWSTRHNARRGERIAVDSQTTKHDLIQLYNIVPDKIDVAYPGIDPDLTRITDPDRLRSVRRKYDIDGSYILYIGTIQPRKNLRRMVSAYLKSGVSHQLVLAGRLGWMAKSIQEDIRQVVEREGHRIRLPGYIEYEDKASLISGATILLFPSLYEGFGFPVLEGQACDTPVLCANSSSLPEVAGDGALLVDPLDVKAIADGIRRLVNDASLRETLRHNGAINVARYNWQSTAEQILTTLVKAADLEGAQQ